MPVETVNSIQPPLLTSLSQRGERGTPSNNFQQLPIKSQWKEAEQQQQQQQQHMDCLALRSALADCSKVPRQRFQRVLQTESICCDQSTGLNRWESQDLKASMSQAFFFSLLLFVYFITKIPFQNRTTCDFSSVSWGMVNRKVLSVRTKSSDL